MYNHNKAQQSKNRVQISGGILYLIFIQMILKTLYLLFVYKEGALSVSCATQCDSFIRAFVRWYALGMLIKAQTNTSSNDLDCQNWWFGTIRYLIK